MNIFSTNICPIQSAKDHCMVHLRKMVVEALQILSTAHFVLDGVQVGYKPTHRNHPSCIWTRNTSANYQWLYVHYKALCEEYTFRTGKVHKSSEWLGVMAVLPKNTPAGSLDPFAMPMPESYQRLGLFDQTKAFQAYLNDKFSEWACRESPIDVSWGSKREQPEWVK